MSGTRKVLRTQTIFYDGPVYSCKRSDFVVAPSWCEALEPSVEINGKTWRSMDPHGIRIFWNEGCHGGRLYIDETGHLAESEPGFKGLALADQSDMSIALMMHASYPTCYFGWIPQVPTGRKKIAYSPEMASYGEFSENVWCSLSLPGNSMADALDTAIRFTCSTKSTSAICNFRIQGSDHANLRLTRLDH